MEEIPPEAYGRVSNSERYAVLHDVAREVVEQLARNYEVVRTQGESADLDVVPPDSVTDVVLLTPPAGSGPLGIGFTRFPGVVIRYGRWRHVTYPHCGCDACDESPERLGAEMVRSLHEFINSRVTETLRRGLKPTLSYRIDGRDQTAFLSRDEARRLGRPEHLEWSPWPGRGEGQLSLAIGEGLEPEPGEPVEGRHFTVPIPRPFNRLGRRMIRRWDRR